MNGYNGNKKIGLVFSGGPAPSANAVISSACLSFLNNNIPVIGFYCGFEFLEKYNSEKGFLLNENIHYRTLEIDIAHIRNRRGVYLKTSRGNPGKDIHSKKDLDDPEKSKKLRNIIEALDSLGIGHLITIGGDDTLKTANYLSLLGFPVIHIPKTIDNDYFGIAWTFGYWSSVQMCKDILLNLKADAESTDSYFIAELMGRKAGWVTYAAGIAGESDLMISSEDIEEKVLDVNKLADKMVDVMISRERRGQNYGVLCVAEGLADKLPDELRPKEKDKHGNILLGTAEVARILKDIVADRYTERTGRKKKITAKQIGYETRTVVPISFDVVLGSMLGFGAYRLYCNGSISCMVSVSDNFQIVAVPFDQLIDPDTLLTKLRAVPKGSDFFELKEALSYI
ncbi:MAG: 6-phosphofructokinase [Candidatus Omnitrophota bacterium]